MADFTLVLLTTAQATKLKPPGLGGHYILTWAGLPHGTKNPYTSQAAAVTDFAATNPTDRLFDGLVCIFPRSMVGQKQPPGAVIPSAPQATVAPQPVQGKPQSQPPKKRRAKDDDYSL